MAEKFSVGTRVQAVDELGRWCHARVVAADVGEGAWVAFPGYPGDDLQVGEDQIRSPVLPFEEQQRRSCRQLGKRNFLKTATKQHLRILAQCQRGDHIETVNGGAVVDTVDPFKRTLSLQNGVSIDLHDIILPPECPKNKQRRTRRKQLSTRLKSDLHQTLTVKKQHDIPAQALLDSTHRHAPYSHQEDGNCVFKVGRHQCGMVYMLPTLNVSVMIAAIDIRRRTATCWPMVGGDIKQDIAIELGLDLLDGTIVSVKGAVKTLGLSLAKAAFVQTQQNMEQMAFRTNFRQLVITEALRREVSSAFWTTTRKKSFDLGLMSPDVDHDMLGLSIPDSTCVEFSYKKGNLEQLDSLLGSRWDVVERDNITRFVTSLRIRVTRDLMITGCIQVADFDGVIKTTTYRQELRKHMHLATSCHV